MKIVTPLSYSMTIFCVKILKEKIQNFICKEMTSKMMYCQRRLLGHLKVKIPILSFLIIQIQFFLIIQILGS